MYWDQQRERERESLLSTTHMETHSYHRILPCALLIVIICCSYGLNVSASTFTIAEATVVEMQEAFKQGTLTSTQLVQYYLSQITALNGKIRGVIEVNPDALTQAEQADQERNNGTANSTGLFGIPVLLKDNISTQDKLNTTAGSFALLGSVVPRDAGVVSRLRSAGAIILGKAALSEWAHYRGNHVPSGWSARGGQAMNPYIMSVSPCGSSTGSAVSVTTNMAAVTLGTETDGSIICPSFANSVVGIKPTVGLTSRSGVVPISARQDTVGPICRTVTDAVYVLNTIVGYDPYDSATEAAVQYVPSGGYLQYLNASGLQGKRLGIIRNPFFIFPNDSYIGQTYERLFQVLSQNGAVLIDNVEINNLTTIMNGDAEGYALSTEFKIALNTYLSELVSSPIATLEDAISFNLNYSTMEMIPQFGQQLFTLSENTTGTTDPEYQAALTSMQSLTENGIVQLMTDYNLDAIVTSNSSITSVLAIGGFPGITVPAGYDEGVPFSICFSGLKGYEPRLIEIAYSYEQATLIRQPPAFLV